LYGAAYDKSIQLIDRAKWQHIAKQLCGESKFILCDKRTLDCYETELYS